MTERVPIASITIERRRREDMGNIEALAKSIDEHGLIHPIVISEENVLIAGERRLHAHEYLGLTTIEARRWLGLDENQRREIELAENLNRKDLTEAERTRNAKALLDLAAEIDRSELATTVVPNSGPGRPVVPGSLKRAAERVGMPEQTARRVVQHAAALDTYPELSDRPQTEAIEAAKALDAMPETKRQETLAIVRNDPESAPAIEDVAYALADDAGRSELNCLRYQRQLKDALRPLARLGSEFDAADTAAAIDEEFFRVSIEIPLEAALAWADRVRSQMPTGLRVMSGGRS